MSVKRGTVGDGGDAVITIACASPPGQGEVGRQFAEMIDDLRWQGRLRRYYSTGLEAAVAAGEGCLISERRIAALLRVGRERGTFDAWESFDRQVAARLVAAEGHLGFAGQSRHAFARASRMGSMVLQLVSPTSHVDEVAARHAEALGRWPLEESWLDDRCRRKVLAEYEMADFIVVSSLRSRRSFLARGVPEQKLRLWQPRPDPRFQPSRRKPPDGIFRIVCAGTQSVLKGVPVLLEALEAIPVADVELTLVGGFSSRSMRRHVEERMYRDRRIRLAAGDPLPHMRRADVLVHPSFEDGPAYEVLEALACEVPVVVSEDSGMEEQIQPGVTGWVVPTGSVEALIDRLESLIAARRPVEAAAPA